MRAIVWNDIRKAIILFVTYTIYEEFLQNWEICNYVDLSKKYDLPEIVFHSKYIYLMFFF